MNKLIKILSLTFFGIMIIFTFTAREIHKQKIPHVDVITLSKQDFICKFTDESGNELSALRRSVGIPKYLNCDELYAIINTKCLLSLSKSPCRYANQGFAPCISDNNNKTLRVYVIMEDEIYGEKRSFAQKTNIVINEDYYSDDYYAAAYGVKAGDKLIVSDNRTISGEKRTEVYYDGE